MYESIQHLEPARQLRKEWNMRIAWIIIVIKKFGTDPNAWIGVWKNWKPEDESRPSKIEHYCDQPRCCEEFWRREKTCCLSDSRKRPTTNPDVKNPREVK